MVDFIDKTSEQSGTPINRQNLMALQGFIGETITKGNDGSIIETNSKGETLTITKNADGSITEVFEGEKTVARTTSINVTGVEVIIQ